MSGLSRRDNGLDIQDETHIEAALKSVSGPFDLVVIATGALEINGAVPEKTIRSVTADAMLDQFRINTIGPALVLKHLSPKLPKDKPAHVVVLSARVGSIGDNALGGWYSYRTAKAAVNQLVHTAAIEFGRSHPHLCCISYHPGTVATEFTRKYVGRHPAMAPQDAARHLLDVVDTLTPENSGQFFDWRGEKVAW